MPAAITEYTVTGTNSSTGCTGTATATIDAASPFRIAPAATPMAICSGGTSTLTAALSNSTYNTATSIPYAAVSNAGTAVLDGEEENTVNVGLPFPFYFYGSAYTSVNICTNGFINFGDPNPDWASYTLPDAGAPLGMIALFEHDMIVSSGSITYQTLGSAPNRKFVISYNAVPDQDASSDNTGQIILYEGSNNIDVLIASCTESTGTYSVTTGIQNIAGDDGLTPSGRNNANFSATNEAWRFTGVPTSGYSYSWTPSTFLSSTTSGAPVASSASVTTTYSVTITDDNSGCAATASTAITVNAQPTATLSVTPSGIVCTGHTVTLNATTTGGAGDATYTWSGPGIVTTTATGTASYTVAATGTAAAYSVALSFTGSGCASVAATSATVTPTAQSWTGAVNNAWENTGNWSCGTIPVASDNVAIPNTGYAPVIASTVTGTTNSLTVSSGVTLTINSGGILQTAGDFTNNGSITGDGSVNLNGTTAQTIYGYNKINNLEINNTSGATIHNSSSDSLVIKGTLTLTNGLLTTNNRLMLFSDANGTGRIGTITGGSITGETTIQQYIPGGRSAWRNWGHSFTSGIALDQLLPYIDITGPGGSANGFVDRPGNAPNTWWYNVLYGDQLSTPDPGVRYFTNTFGTPDSNLLHQFQGCAIRMRGGKGEGLSGGAYTPSAVTIRMHGTVNTGDVHIIMRNRTPTDSVTAMYSNPYPSPVDIGTALKRAWDAGKLHRDRYFVYDPYLGSIGQWVAIAIDGTPYYLPANSAFSVRTELDSNTLDFTEADKSATISGTLFKSEKEQLELNIYDTQYRLWDALHIYISQNNSNDKSNCFSTGKPSGPAALDFYSLSSNNTKLCIDRRAFSSNFSVPLGIRSDVKQQFIIKASNIPTNIEGNIYLHDKYLHKEIKMLAGSEYEFTITDDIASQGDHRFELRSLPENIETRSELGLTITPNPTNDKIKIQYTASGEEEAFVTITNAIGQSFAEVSLGKMKYGEKAISLENAPAGIYLVTLNAGNKRTTLKVVKE